MGRNSKIVCKNVFLNGSVSKEELTRKWAELFCRLERYEGSMTETDGRKGTEEKYINPLRNDRYQ